MIFTINNSDYSSVRDIVKELKEDVPNKCYYTIDKKSSTKGWVPFIDIKSQPFTFDSLDGVILTICTVTSAELTVDTDKGEVFENGVLTYRYRFTQTE